MGTTNSAFLKKTNATLNGATVGAAGEVVAMNPTSANQLAASGYGTRVDRAVSDLATDGYAKNGCIDVSLSGTTPKTVDLTDLTSQAASNAGDTGFDLWNKLVFANLSSGNMTVAPGSSNPASIFLGGTSPTMTVAANSSNTLMSLAGVTVDSTHKTITITPTVTGHLVISVGGA